MQSIEFTKLILRIADLAWPNRAAHRDYLIKMMEICTHHSFCIPIWQPAAEKSVGLMILIKGGPLVPADTEKARMQDIRDTFARLLQMISEDGRLKNHSARWLAEVTDYALWFEEKYKYKFRNPPNSLVVKKGEIYHCNFGRNIGSEQDKFRPAIVLQNDKGNLHSPTTIVAPITDETKAKLPTHIYIRRLKPDCPVRGVILVEQMRCISKNRLSNRIDVIDTKTPPWEQVMEAIKIELDLCKKN